VNAFYKKSGRPGDPGVRAMKTTLPLETRFIVLIVWSDFEINPATISTN